MATNINSLIDFAVRHSESQRVNSRKWTPEEDAFLKTNLGKMTEAAMGKALGRTETAVHLRWKRDLQLVSPSKAPDVITAHQAARMLGIDGHKIAHWVDQGFIPGRLMAGGRKIRLIDRKVFIAWVMDHDHWMYFDLAKVQDEELKQSLAEESKRWGDEWWETPRVAKHHGVATSDVKRYIKAGRIKATQIQYSYGGRHLNLSWKLWFVLRSEATRKSLHFVRRKKSCR